MEEKTMEERVDEVMKEEDTYVLSTEDVAKVKEYQRAVDLGKVALGNMRRQYLIQESKLMAGMTKAENDFLGYVRGIIEEKDEDPADNWVLDQSTYTLYKNDS
jgi:hypothetical protein